MVPGSFEIDELAVVRRAYARKMLAILDVVDPAIETAFAVVPREKFLGDPPWQIASRGGHRLLPTADPVLVYQDRVIPLSPSRGVNNGSPALHAKLLEALGPRSGDRIAHVGAGTGYYTAILAELVGPSGQVVAVEFDPALAGPARQNLADRRNVEVVTGDGADWPREPVDGVYVNFAVMRPADRWIENLKAAGRLVFPLGVPGRKRTGFGGRHSDHGAALRIERRPGGFSARAVSPAYFVWGEGKMANDAAEAKALRAAFDAGGLESVRSLVWKAPARSDQCWFVGRDWALGYGGTAETL